MRSDRRVRRDEVWFEITQYLDPRSGHLATEIGELSIPHVEGADHRVGVGAPSTQRRARSLEQRRPLPQHPVVVREERRHARHQEHRELVEDADASADLELTDADPGEAVDGEGAGIETYTSLVWVLALIMSGLLLADLFVTTREIGRLRRVEAEAGGTP